MERLYPRALLECIQENRLPMPEEIEIVAGKISREAFPDGRGAHVAPLLAQMAMAGSRVPPRLISCSGIPGEV